MLVAITMDGNHLSLVEHSLSKTELLEQRKNEKFYCPACHNEVVLKLGDIHIWHFAHKKTEACAAQLEGETTYHITGKKLLYNWLKAQGLEVYLEPYIREIQQRPDILLKVHDKIYPIEFQCAKIPQQLFHKRTKEYRKLNYEPIWIVGEKQLKRITSNMFQIASFQWLFSYDSNKLQAPQIFSFCPNQNSFIILHQLISITSTRSIATPTILPLTSTTFNSLLKIPNDHPSLEKWELAKINWRTYRVKISRSEKYLQKILYTRGIPLWLFPCEAGFPVRYHHFIEAPLFVWQTWLLDCFILHKSIGKSFHLSAVIRAFRTLCDKGIFRIRPLPLQKQGGEREAIRKYLLFLCKLGILSTENSTVFTIIKLIDLPKTLETALEQDRLIAQRLMW